MGCDIHLYTEILNNKGKWVPNDKWEDNPYNYEEEGDPHRGVHYDNQVWSERNYTLFAILADVRNNYGFAGVNLGNRFNPISDPKGLPHDVSDEIKGESDRWGGDGHSHSHLSLSELLNYDWLQVITRRGVVNLDNYKSWRWDKECPESWSGTVSGGSVKIVEMEEADKLLDASSSSSSSPFTTNWYVNIEWRQLYASCVEKFPLHTIPLLQEMGKPDEVRIVFWFDN